MFSFHQTPSYSIYKSRNNAYIQHNKFLPTFRIKKPTRRTNFSILFWNKTLRVSGSSSLHHQEFQCTHSNGIRHTGFQTACKQDHPDPACKLSENRYDVYHCCVYSEILLMMDRGTVQNMKSFIPK